MKLRRSQASEMERTGHRGDEQNPMPRSDERQTETRGAGKDVSDHQSAE